MDTESQGVDQIATPVMPLAQGINAESLIGKIVTRADFVEIDGKIEPTRDLCLKLFATSRLSYDTQLLSTQPLGSTIAIAVKARVYHDGKGGKKVAEGLGGCTTEETARSGKRAYHDALARAETRAFKRALEAAVGLPFINQLIVRLFGGYEGEPAALGIAEERLVEVLKGYIDRVSHLKHLENWGRKYVAIVHLLSEAGRSVIRGYYGARRRALMGSPEVGGLSYEEVHEMARVAKVEEDRELVLDLAREFSREQRAAIEQTLDRNQRSW